MSTLFSLYITFVHYITFTLHYREKYNSFSQYISYYLLAFATVSFLLFKVCILHFSSPNCVVIMQNQNSSTQALNPTLYSSVAQSGTSASSSVNKAIQSLAHRYCVECKANFDDLSKIIQVWIEFKIIFVSKIDSDSLAIASYILLELTHYFPHFLK